MDYGVQLFHILGLRLRASIIIHCTQYSQLESRQHLNLKWFGREVCSTRGMISLVPPYFGTFEISTVVQFQFR